ncbi:regulatory protein GemA [Martelella mediterranea]|uniref:Mu-like prophage protein gp16 n=1 Tax=Martelella mediterranea DSM 17316 TaxID=1122214 RepID=A0A1U9Z2V3_9HYPH|nr:regulatory protein GemA [Martelella mediterranea]AQZ51932.1 Mu-like prophage protein gp16 [Martelella mediterranea DSM 17316]
MSVYRRIHAISNTLGLDDEARRTIYQRVTGKPTLTLMSDTEKDAVAAEFRRLGGDRRPDGRKKLSGPFAPKLQALWIGAWNLGIVENRDDKALLAFVKRQTGIDHTRFLYYADDAAKAIEALKAWIAREANVDWRVHRKMPLWRQAEGYKIAVAQWALLQQDPKDFWSVASLLSGADPGVRDLTRGEWIKVMNSLGEGIRKMKAEAR